MKIQLNAEQVKLKKELREYFSEMMTPALIEECERDLGEGGGPLWRGLETRGTHTAFGCSPP